MSDESRGDVGDPIGFGLCIGCSVNRCGVTAATCYGRSKARLGIGGRDLEVGFGGGKVACLDDVGRLFKVDQPYLGVLAGDCIVSISSRQHIGVRLVCIRNRRRLSCGGR